MRRNAWSRPTASEQREQRQRAATAAPAPSATAATDGDDGQRHRDAKDPIAQRRTHADDCTLHAIWHTVADSLARLSTANPGYAAAAFLLYVVSLVIAGARWRGFLRALGGEVTVMRATLATLGGIAAGNLTPAPGGEACRIGLVRLGGRATWRRRRSPRSGIDCPSCRRFWC